MKRENKGKNIKTQLAAVFLLITFIIVLIVWGIHIWKNYRDELIANQKEQLLITSQALAKNTSMSLSDYKDDLELLAEIEKSGDESDEFYSRYLETQGRFEVDLAWEDGQGNFQRSINGTELINPVFLTKADESNSIWKYEDKESKNYMVFKRQLDDGTALCLVIDGEAYYRQIISDIHVGTNGYVVIKNSEGIIIMHPEREQWGIDVIEGRKEMYPELDFSSLEQMVKEQNSGKSGLSEYYSYWWTKEELPRVKKVSAYTPAEIGNDFWVISIVIDYDDLYVPVAEGVQNITMIFGVGMLFFMLLAVYIGKLLYDRRRADSEIGYLRELNQVLEEMHRSEETIAHQQRLQIMGTMTGGIAHEFNNFLTPIMGHAELLMMELADSPDEYESAQEIYEASEKAKDVIRQLSSMSRKNVETVYKNISCEKFLTRGVKLVESVCPANIKMEKKIEETGQYILGNSTQLSQVLLNICVNAIHAMGHKDGILKIEGCCEERAALKKYVEAETTGVWEEYFHITVKDNGCGMDSDTLKHIFEPFFTTKKSGEGTGLGLALAEQIISSHKGYICAESEVGVGTVFHIFLPVNEGETYQVQAEGSDDFHFVIADDNAKILQMLGKSLEKFKISVTTCTTKKELETCIRGQRTDVLLIDESLDDGSGIDYCMTLQGRYPDMLRILMTDRVTREIAEAKQRQIINMYIEKPVSAQSVLEAVHICTGETE